MKKVQVADIDNCNRFETHIIAGEANSGCICLNGATAKHVEVSDKVIIAYVQMTPKGTENHYPKFVFINDKIKISEVVNYEKRGERK